jgi:shikimate 5-dehydrogenase
MHNYWLKQYGLVGAYVRPIAPKISACVATSPHGICRRECPVPHGVRLRSCRRIDDNARITGAVNTLISESGTVTGLNTDVSFAAKSPPVLARRQPPPGR